LSVNNLLTPGRRVAADNSLRARSVIQHHWVGGSTGRAVVIGLERARFPERQRLCLPLGETDEEYQAAAIDAFLRILPIRFQ